MSSAVNRVATGIATTRLTLAALPAKAAGADGGVLAMYCAAVALGLFAFAYTIRGGTLVFGVINLTPVFLLVAVLCLGVHFRATREIRFQLIWADVALIGLALVLLANSSSAAGLEKGLRFVALVLAPYFLARLILVDFRWVKCFLITALAAATIIGVGAFAFTFLPEGVARLLPYEIVEWNERLVFLKANPIQLGILCLVGITLYVGLMSGWRRIWIIPGLAVAGALLYTLLIVGTRASLVALVGALSIAFLLSLITRRFSNFPVLLIAFGVTAFLLYEIFVSGLTTPVFVAGDAAIRHAAEPKRVGEAVSAYLVRDHHHRADDDVVTPWHWERANPRPDAPHLPDESTWAWAYTDEREVYGSFNYTPTDVDRGKFLRAYVYYQRGDDAYRAETPAVGPIVAASADPTLVKIGEAGIDQEAEPKRVGEAVAAYLVHDGPHRANDSPVQPWYWERADPRPNDANRPDNATWAATGGAGSFSYIPTDADRGKFLRAYVHYEKVGETYRAQTPAIGPIGAPAAAATQEKIGEAGFREADQPKRVGQLITAYLVSDRAHRHDDNPMRAWQWQRANPQSGAATLPDATTWADIDGARSYQYSPTGADRGKFLRAYVEYEKEGATYQAQTPAIGPVAAGLAREGTISRYNLPRAGITLPNQQRFETLALPVNPNAENSKLAENVIQNRVDLTSEALTKFRDNPLRGAGTAGMDIYAHNIFLETAAELGLIGLVFLVAFLILALVSLWKGFIRLDQRNPYFHLITAVFLVVAALFIQKQFSTNLADHKDLIIFAAIILNLPLLLGMPGRARSGGLREKVPPRFRFLIPARDSGPVGDEEGKP